jgi:hypothetical protein
MKSSRTLFTPFALPARGALALALAAGCGAEPEEATGASEAAVLASTRPTGVLDSGIRLDATTGVVTVTGSSAGDTGSATMSGTSVVVTRGAFSVTYAASALQRIVFDGLDGDDTFINLTSVPSTLNGGPGNDTLRGGAGPDLLVGDFGDDTLLGEGGDDVILGSGGHDTLNGGDGADNLRGHGGNDTLDGGAHRDLLNGGSGNDTLRGGSGMDTLVAIGGGTDSVTGGSQWDVFWLGTEDTLADASPDELAQGRAHRVAGFMSLPAPAAEAETVGLELDGPALRDPVPHLQDLTLARFPGAPLFPAAGPGKADVLQGGIGDCYFMAALSAFADAFPEHVRIMVGDLGDGTYVVRFFSAGQPVYVRVDGDLWTTSSGAPAYAKRGDDGALWVPIVEKAYAFFRRQMGTYASIASGDGTHYGHLGLETSSFEIAGPLTPEQVIAWDAKGRPAGAVRDRLLADVAELFDFVANQQAGGLGLTTGARSGVSDSTALALDDEATPNVNEGTFRRGQHIYMVDRVEFDAGGRPAAFVLRDPYGMERALTDPARIWFCVGRAGTLSP